MDKICYYNKNISCKIEDKYYRCFYCDAPICKNHFLINNFCEECQQLKKDMDNLKNKLWEKRFQLYDIFKYIDEKEFIHILYNITH